MPIFSKGPVPHYWVRTRPFGASGMCTELCMEFRHGDVMVDTLRDYKFQSVRAKNLKVGDIVNAAHRGMAGGNPFFGYVQKIEYDRYTGTVEIEMFKIESKIQPHSV